MLIPFTWQDQAILDLENASGPWNIQFELGTAQTIDLDRLRRALLSACRQHPLASARMRPGTSLSPDNAWETVDLAGPPPVPVLDAAGEDELSRLRTDFYSPPISLNNAPAFRVQVVREGGTERMMMCAAHSMVDGIGLLRLGRSITRAYRGEPDPPDTVSLTDARELRRVTAPATREEAGQRALEGLRKLRDAASAPARIAPDSTDQRDGGGHVHVNLSAEQTSALNARRPKGTTMNDLILSAVSRAITRWNAEHGAAGDRVQLFMPVSLRPTAWSDQVVSNLFSYVSVGTRARERPTLEDGAVTIAAQTEPIRRSARAGGTQDLLRAVSKLPLGVKGAMPHLLTATGNRFVDTAVVSNLGRHAELPSFAGTQPETLAFTPPYWSAAAVSVGAISVSGALQLGVRHRLTTLDVPAGRAFAATLLSELT